MSDNSYTNLQIKTTDADLVRQAIAICDIGSAKVIARIDVPFVSVYPFLTEDDFTYLKQVAAKMSNRLQVPVFGFIVPKSSVFKYALFLGDKLLDEYDSERPESGGNIEIVLPLCAKGATKKRLQQLLHPREQSTSERAGDRMAREMAELLGIPRVQMCTGFNHLKWAQAGR